MPIGEETRVTKVSSLSGKIVAPGESCLVQIYGPDLGKRYPLDVDEITIGRDAKCSIVVDLDNVSRKHARVAAREAKAYVCDLGSTNGTYLNDQEVLNETPLRSGDLIKVGGAIFKFLYGGNVEALYYEEIYRMAIIDGLTQIFNKRYFTEFLEREMARCHRYARALSLVMFDIDHFKKINDEHGHLAGDAVLRELAGLVRAKVRKEECVARYGGEEFTVIMPESGPEKVRRFADKLLRLVSDHEFNFEGNRIPVTISIGVSDMSPEITEPPQFIKATDAMLYKAKREGRNRVCG
jgi:diguanylate cyclase (GGDEF)-like protein